MSFFQSVKLIELPGNTAQSPVARRRNKLAEKVEQQIQLAFDPNYAPTKIVWSKDNAGNEHRVEQPKRIKRWWIEQVDGSVLLTVRYGNKALELAKGKSAIRLDNKMALEATLRSLKLAVLAGEFDTMLETQVGYQSGDKRLNKS